MEMYGQCGKKVKPKGSARWHPPPKGPSPFGIPMMGDAHTLSVGGSAVGILCRVTGITPARPLVLYSAPRAPFAGMKTPGGGRNSAVL